MDDRKNQPESDQPNGQQTGDPNAKPSALDPTVDEDAGDKAAEDQTKGPQV